MYLTHKVVSDAMFQIIEKMDILMVTLERREHDEPTKLERVRNG